MSGDLLKLYPVEALAQALESLKISPQSGDGEASRCMRILGNFNGNALGIVSFSGQTGWECHPHGDEMLYYLEGQSELSLLTDCGEVRRLVRQGEAVQIPKGLWHSQRTLTPVRLFFITPGDGTMHRETPP